MNSRITHCTSANMDGNLFDQISEAGDQFNIQADTIFKDLLEITKQNIHSEHVYGLLTEYQNHSPERWEKLHYALNEEEIEKFGKMRQKYKMSISKLAFVGFVLFWELLMFIYKERLKESIPADFFCSYREVREKFESYIPYFTKRLNIIQRE